MDLPNHILSTPINMVDSLNDKILVQISHIAMLKLSFHNKLVLIQSCFLFISFVLQLLAVLSVPITSSISLCTFQGYKFGVFGLCDDNVCTSVRIGYKPSELSDLSGFSLPSNARHSISFLLVVHPISLAFTGAQLIMTVLLLFKKFSSWSKFLLLILFWTLPTFLLSLLSFLVDILLFIPHLNWCGWTLLVPVVLSAFCGTTLCILRRTVSSRLAYRSIQDKKQNGVYLSAYGNELFEDDQEADGISSDFFDRITSTTHISSYVGTSFRSSLDSSSPIFNIANQSDIALVAMPPESATLPNNDRLQHQSHERNVANQPTTIFTGEHESL